jgi:hypothetical protein
MQHQHPFAVLLLMKSYIGQDNNMGSEQKPAAGCQAKWHQTLPTIAQTSQVGCTVSLGGGTSHGIVYIGGVEVW